MNPKMSQNVGFNTIYMKNDANTPIKLGFKLTFYGLYGCTSCAILLPLLSYADRMHLFEKVVEIDYDSKESYKKNISSILQAYGRLDKILPSPIILIQKKVDSIELLVEPDIVNECTVELSDSITRLGERTLIKFLDGKYIVDALFTKLLLKMTTNAIFPQDYRKK